MTTNWLDDFHGQHITVLTQSSSEEKSETGTLLRVADGWLQLVKDNGEMLLIPSTAIRIVKLLEMAHRTVVTESLPERLEPVHSYGAGNVAVRGSAPDDESIF